MSNEADVTAASAERPLRWWSRLWAFVISPVFPGIGQALRGAYGRAWAFAAAVLLGLTLFRGLPYLWPRQPSAVVGAIFIELDVAILAVVAAAAIDAARFRNNLASRRDVWWQRWLIYGALVVVSSVPQFVSNRLHWESFSIPSTSMEPTLLAGDIILIVDGYHQAYAPQHGDLAVFKLPCDYPQLEPAIAARYRKACDTSIDFVKRIVGIAGDHVQIKRGILVVNDTPASRRPDGSYLVTGGLHPQTWQKYRESLSGAAYDVVIEGDNEPLENTDPFVVPTDRCFVIGDNRDNSVDSRDPIGGIGLVPTAKLVGLPTIVLFSSNGSARWWEVWKWPSAIRWSRIGKVLQ